MRGHFASDSEGLYQEKDKHTQGHRPHMGYTVLPCNQTIRPQ